MSWCIDYALLVKKPGNLVGEQVAGRKLRVIRDAGREGRGGDISKSIPNQCVIIYAIFL